MNFPPLIPNNTAILFLFDLFLKTFEYMNINYYAKEFRNQNDTFVLDQSLWRIILSCW